MVEFVNPIVTFEFDLKRDLHVIWAAYLNGGLQMQKEVDYWDGHILKGSTCTYAGPCGLGSCIPVEDRAAFDEVKNFRYMDKTLPVPHALEVVEPHSPACSEYFNVGIFTTAEGTHEGDIEIIQISHDAYVGSKRENFDDFEVTMQLMAEKYGVTLTPKSIALSA